MIEKKQISQAINNSTFQITKNWFEENNSKVPIKQGCLNTVCNCTGDCQKIIGYRDKLPGEF